MIKEQRLYEDHIKLNKSNRFCFWYYDDICKKKISLFYEVVHALPPTEKWKSEFCLRFTCHGTSQRSFTFQKNSNERIFLFLDLHHRITLMSKSTSISIQFLFLVADLQLYFMFHCRLLKYNLFFFYYWKAYKCGISNVL